MCRGELPKIDRSSDSVRLGFDRKSKRRETRLRALCVPSHLGLGPGCKNKEKPMTVCNRRSRVFSLFLISQASVPITTIQFQVRCSATWALVDLKRKGRTRKTGSGALFIIFVNRLPNSPSPSLLVCLTHRHLRPLPPNSSPPSLPLSNFLSVLFFILSDFVVCWARGAF